MTIRDDLAAMGYREVKRGQWMKPIGYQCFVYDEKTERWSNWFKSKSGGVEIYESKLIKDNVPHLDQLKQFEAFTRTNVVVDCNSKFEVYELLENTI